MMANNARMGQKKNEISQQNAKNVNYLFAHTTHTYSTRCVSEIGWPLSRICGETSKRYGWKTIATVWAALVECQLGPENLIRLSAGVRVSDRQKGVQVLLKRFA